MENMRSLISLFGQDEAFSREFNDRALLTTRHLRAAASGIRGGKPFTR